MLLPKEIRSRTLAKLSAMVFCYSLATSLIAIFLPEYYLKVGSGDILWVVEFLATQFLVLGLFPRFSIRLLHHSFEKLIFASFGFYSLYDILLIYSSDPFLIGGVAGLALGTFWPSFNVLQLRLSDRSNRTTTINTVSILVMTAASTVGPLVGGIVISFGGGFTNALITSTFVYLLAILAMRGFPFEPASSRDPPRSDIPFSISPSFSSAQKRIALRSVGELSNKKFRLFALGCVLKGMADGTWFVYPIFALQITRSYMELGITASSTALAVACLSVVVGRISDGRKSRYGPVLAGIVLNCSWYLVLPWVSNPSELVAVSMLTGLAGALGSNISAWLGDEFPRSQYPSILARVEAYLMIGRLSNLALVIYFFAQYSSHYNFTGYFDASALILCLSIPVYYLLEKENAKQAAPRKIPLPSR